MLEAITYFCVLNVCVLRVFYCFAFGIRTHLIRMPWFQIFLSCTRDNGCDLKEKLCLNDRVGKKYKRVMDSRSLKKLPKLQKICCINWLQKS